MTQASGPEDQPSLKCGRSLQDCMGCHVEDGRFNELMDRLKESSQNGMTLLLLGSHLTGRKEFVCAEWFLKLAEKQLGKSSRPVRLRKGILLMMTGKVGRGALLIKRAMSGTYSRDFSGMDDPIEWGFEFQGLDRVQDLVEVIKTGWPTKRTKEVALEKAEQYLTWTPLIDAKDWERFGRTLMSVGHYHDSLEAVSIAREIREGKTEDNVGLWEGKTDESEQEEELIPRTATGERPSWELQNFTGDYTDAQTLLRKGNWKEGIEAIISALNQRGVDERTEVERRGFPNTRPYVLTWDDVIDMQIKESIMARHAMEETPYDYGYRDEYGDDYYG